MSNFFDYYVGLEQLYESVLRGNEIELQYANKKYYILPYFTAGHVSGARIGEQNAKDEKICFSAQELSEASIENCNFGKILSKIKITFVCF